MGMASPSEPAYEKARSASEDIHSLSCDAKQSHPHREPIRVVAERKSLRWRMPKASFKKGERVREDETENVREKAVSPSPSLAVSPLPLSAPLVTMSPCLEARGWRQANITMAHPGHC